MIAQLSPSEWSVSVFSYNSALLSPVESDADDDEVLMGDPDGHGRQQHQQHAATTRGSGFVPSDHFAGRLLRDAVECSSSGDLGRLWRIAMTVSASLLIY
jgi:hypothetical protein